MPFLREAFACDIAPLDFFTVPFAGLFLTSLLLLRQDFRTRLVSDFAFVPAFLLVAAYYAYEMYVTASVLVLVPLLLFVIVTVSLVVISRLHTGLGPADFLALAVFSLVPSSFLPVLILSIALSFVYLWNSGRLTTLRAGSLNIPYAALTGGAFLLYVSFSLLATGLSGLL